MLFFIALIVNLVQFVVTQTGFPIGKPSIPPAPGRQCGKLKFDDDYFKLQWYLRKYPPFHYDMNVVPVWQDCINGTGITVGVVDGGIMWKDPDISHKKNVMASFDFNPHDEHDFRHGTMMAGVIAAAANNSHLGVGVAFGSMLTDIRALIQHPSSQSLQNALFQGINVVDIYCCAFTNYPSGFTTYPLDPNVKNSLEFGTANGRNRKGSIYVWSTGNGGEETSILKDSCAYEGLVNNIYVIPVAGIQYNLKRLTTAEQCSAIMIAAFSRNIDDRYATMITTISGGTVGTNNFGENSAAVAVISGAIALALQANPRLFARDVMHLLTLSARNDRHFDEFSPSDFEGNQAGFRVSLTFGFGLLDVQNFVTRAIKWRNVGNRLICTLIKATGQNLEFRVPKSCSIVYLEHVIVRLSVNSSTAGGWKISIQNSHNTSSLLLPGRTLDKSKNLTVEVMSVKFWGENPQQTSWKIHHDDMCKDTLSYCIELIRRNPGLCDKNIYHQYMSECKASCGFCGNLDGSVAIHGLAELSPSLMSNQVHPIIPNILG